MRWFLLATALAVAFLIALQWIKQTQPVDRLGNDHFTEIEGRLLYDGRPFSGTAIERFPSGLIYQETQYETGLKDGFTREFANNGARRALWHYKAGRKHGVQEGWFIEGPKRFVQHYRDGILEGVQTDWHMNGTLFNQQTFADGVETQRKVLYPTAEVFSNYVKKGERTFGVDGGALCFEVKREGEK